MIPLIIPFVVCVAMWYCCCRRRRSSEYDEEGEEEMDDDDSLQTSLTDDLDDSIYKRIAPRRRRKKKSATASRTSSVVSTTSNVIGHLYHTVFKCIWGVASCGASTLGCCGKLILGFLLFIIIWLTTEFGIAAFGQRFTRV